MKDFFELLDHPEYQKRIPKLSRDDPADAISQPSDDHLEIKANLLFREI